jgi:hypothetical protein
MGSTRLVAAICLALAGSATTAHAEDIFAFKDLEGYQKCLATDHLLESTTTKDGSQKRLLSQVEIQLKCVDAAVKLAQQTKKKELTAELIKATKRLSAWENAVDLINVLVDSSLPDCNEMAYYEVLTKALSAPRDHNRYFPRTKTVVKKCLKDKQFKADFLEEKDSSKAYLGDNACAILLEEKLVKACPKKEK